MLVIVATQKANIRATPNGAILGQVKRGQKIAIDSLNGDWLGFAYWDKRGWIAKSVVIVENGDLSTLTGFSEVANAVKVSPGLSLAGYSVDPLVPVPNQPFSVKLQIKNNATEIAESFALAATWPDQQFNLLTIPRLDAGATGELIIPCNGLPRTGFNEVRLVLDVNRALNVPIADSMPSVKVWIDYPKTAQASIVVPPFSNIDLWGGVPDLQLDGMGFSAINGAKLVETSLRVPELHYDLIVEMQGDDPSMAMVGDTYLVKLAEKERFGYMRIADRDGEKLIIEYGVY